MAMQYAKTLKVAVLSVIAAGATAVLLTVATVPFTAPSADATPAIAKGKACKSCHSSAKPSKADVKKKKKKKRGDIIWPGVDESIALLSFEDQIAHAELHR
jgi:hypothetical protein